MFFSSPNHWQSIPILASIPEQIPGSLLALDHKQDTIEPPNKSRARNAAGSAGLSFIALFLCDERASIRKLKMYFAFRSPLPFPLLSGEKRMKCNKSETEMGTPHGAPGTRGLEFPTQICRPATPPRHIAVPLSIFIIIMSCGGGWDCVSAERSVA